MVVAVGNDRDPHNFTSIRVDAGWDVDGNRLCVGRVNCVDGVSKFTGDVSRQTNAEDSVDNQCVTT